MIILYPAIFSAENSLSLQNNFLKNIVELFCLKKNFFSRYPEYKYVWLGTKSHNRCGMRSACKECFNIINNHDETEIIKEIEKYIKIN